MVIAQVAVSIVLLTGAGLMMRSFFALTHVDLGFRPYSVLYIRLDLPKGRYEAAQPRRILLRKIVERVKALPGVLAAAETWMLPPEDAIQVMSTFLARNIFTNGTQIQSLQRRLFSNIRSFVAEGHALSEGDVESARHVAVINQALARTFFGKGDPIGQVIKFNQFDTLPNAPHDTYFQIIGMVADYRNAGLKHQPVPEAFLPYTIAPLGVPNILARTALTPNSSLKAVNQAVWTADPEVGINMSGSLGNLLDEYEYQEPQFEFVILAAFAGIGLLLVIVGVYSVTAYTVARGHTKSVSEPHWGAQPGSIVRLVLRRAFALIATGILLGVFGSLGLTRFLASQIWSVSPTDPWTFAAVVACVLVAGLVACTLPARRAAQVDPLIAVATSDQVLHRPKGNPRGVGTAN